MSAVDNLRSALKTGESETVEFVAPTDRAQLLRTICAFANTLGGVIYMGVNDSSEVVGVDPDQALKHLANLQDHFGDSTPTVNINNIEYPGVKLPVFQVRVHKNENDSPLRFKNAVWKRKSATNVSERVGHDAAVSDSLKLKDEAEGLLARETEGERESGDREGEPTAQKSEQDDSELNRESQDAEADASQREPDSTTASVDVPSPDDVSSTSKGSTASAAEAAPPESSPGTGVAQDEPPPIAHMGSRTRIQREAGESELSLNADEYAEVIANIFSEATDDEQMSFALFGHWGRGKTYQMGRVTKRLEQLGKEGGKKYAIVQFSAWKYRTTPEVWAYLFENFLAEGQRHSHLLALRAAFTRQGPWQLIVVLFTLFLALWTVGEKANIVTGLIQAFGAGTVLYVAFLYVRFRAAAVRLKSLYSFSGHADRLGLQAAIGDDLRALFQAWIPCPDENRQAITNSHLLVGLYWLLYILVCLLISWQLFPVKDLAAQTLLLPFVGEVSMAIDPYVALVPYSVWLLLWVVGPFLVLHGWRSTPKGRVLLVVDDLDRCEPNQMLEIIESIMLILDDDEMSKRLQVAMLIDESAFQKALLHKYDHLIDKPSVSKASEVVKEESNEKQPNEYSEHTYTPERIIRENQEKFFLLHLRLPRLSDEEIVAITGTFAKQLSDSPPETTLLEEIDDAIDEKQASAKDTEMSDTEADEPPQGTIELSDTPIAPEEVNALQMKVRLAIRDHSEHTLGPRAIRCILFRYQLARGILIKLGQMPNPSDWSREIVHTYLGVQRDPGEDESLLDRVVRQVS